VVHVEGNQLVFKPVNKQMKTIFYWISNYGSFIG
jgi:hypothetical protein